ncbi:hypothetical protein AB1Y20_019135 [Prymnesium parvum]|uniref:AAA+ ATPase domain-containing protein n=1 Tax=Prymnesium parvum TaxID=97485 RepID=A0AB34JUX4_PRYPA
MADVRLLSRAILAGERAALSRGISLVESRLTTQREAARMLLKHVLPQRSASASLRIGVSGPPGTGKSTLIEALGGVLLDRGHRLAVLAIDPSSHRTGGSVMGDKTRMPRLAADRRAYIRPSPSQGTLGGVARRTEEAALLCECGGYDRVIVETVGVGQSEVAVAGMTDMFVLLVPPSSGDGLQGIKRGIMEMADAVIVTKCDGQLEPAALSVARDLRAALKLFRPRLRSWRPSVMTSSSFDRESTLKVADLIEEFHATTKASGDLVRRREEQALRAIWDHACAEVLERLPSIHGVDELVRRYARESATGDTSPSLAADAIASYVLRSASHAPDVGQS